MYDKICVALGICFSIYMDLKREFHDPTSVKNSMTICVHAMGEAGKSMKNVSI